MFFFAFTAVKRPCDGLTYLICLKLLRSANSLPLVNSPSINSIVIMTSPRFCRIEVSYSEPNVLFKATVYGKPAALQRPRIKFPLFFRNHFGRSTRQSRPHLWNPSSGDQQEIRMLIKNYLETSGGVEYNENAPFFHEGTAIKVKLTFFMNRPSSHFLPQANVGAAVRAFNFVKDGLKYIFHLRTPDLDNMMKFMLDSPMEGVIFKNDSNVTAIEATKTFDNIGECHGRIHIEVSPAALVLDLE